MRKFRGFPAVMLVAASTSGAAQAGTLLDEYVAMQVGDFTSEAQAAQDSRYDVANWHIAEIWGSSKANERWLYTESWIEGAPVPYLQRISRATEQPDGTISVRRYALPEAARFTGGWKDTTLFGRLNRDELAEMAGCDLLVMRAGEGRFEGSTVGNRCLNSYKGAAYATSRSVLTAQEMLNWDRGFTADGKLAWGPAAGGYRFRRAGEQGACLKPVRMLVFGEVRDRKAFGAYARALAQSGLYARNGGYYEATSPAIDVFEGEPPEGRGVIIARFPCAEAARRFWNSDEYREIRKLREEIADFEVLLLPVPPLPKDASTPLQ
jgi:uncharacterized protein (DUF1330 family)